MSRERELLQKVVNHMWQGELVDEIKECLAQPEQDKAGAVMPNGVCVSNVYDAYEEGRKSVMVEQEPVAWMNDSGGCFLSDGNKYSENWTALYTAPPKREPLTPQQISEGNQSTLNVTREAFKQGVKFAEKAHGITGVDDDN